MDTQALIARLRERAATQDACGCWSLDKVAADELDRLRKIEIAARQMFAKTAEDCAPDPDHWVALGAALGTA